MGKKRRKHDFSEEKEDEGVIVVSKTVVWQAVAGIFAVLFVASLFTGGFGFTGKSVVAGNGEQEEPAPDPVGGFEFNLEGARTMGDPDAPVVMVEWSDFRCPFCQRFWKDTLPRIKEEYVDTGKVFFVYKDFPVVGGSAEASAGWCAHEQGMFWEYHDKLLENLQQGSPENFVAWAGEVGMDTDAFRGCVQSDKYAQNVARDAAEGRDFGIQGAPGFYINGEAVSGAQPFQNFQQVIESQLN